MSTGAAPKISFRSSSIEMVRGLVGHGLGYSLLATKPASNMTYDGRALATVKLDREYPGSQVVLTYKEGATLSPIATAFADYCRVFFNKSVL